jgi:hypothetical protein
MNYMHKAIETLFTQNIKTIPEYENHLANRSKNTSTDNKNTKKQPATNKFHNFNQREKYSNDELEKKLGIKK